MCTLLPPSHSPQELPGFTEEPAESEAKFVTTGFARNAVLGVAGDVVKAVQEVRAWVAVRSRLVCVEAALLL